MADAHTADHHEEHWLFSRLPPWVMQTLTSEQKEAINEAASEKPWRSHPVDIRLTLPLLKSRYYLTIVGGREKRSPNRLDVDRKHYPLKRVANIFFFLGIATIFYIVAIVAMALSSAIVEF